MLGISFEKIMLIALLALVVLGPEKLPKIAAQLGRWSGRARSMARNLRQQLEAEISYDELLKQKQAAEEALRKAASAPMDFHQNLDRNIDAAVNPSDTVAIANDQKQIQPPPQPVAAETPADPANQVVADPHK